MKIRDVIKLVEQDGWHYAAQTGSHRHYKHPVKKGRVTIAGHPGRDLSQSMIGSILKQAGLTRKDLPQ